MNEIDFIHENLPKEDDQLFGLTNPEVFFSGNTWADIAVMAGLFKSKSQAKKNGWGDDLEPGLQQKTLKKKRLLITVLNEF